MLQRIFLALAITALVLGLGCVHVVLAGSSESCVPEDLDAIRLAFEHSSEGVYVVSGTGKRILQLGPKRGSKARPVDPVHSTKGVIPKGGTSYFAPEVDPDQERLVTVKCSGVIKRAGSAADCAIVVIDIETGENRIAYTPSAGANIDEPTWSPDGGKLAFFEDRDVVVIDENTGRVIERLTNVRMHNTGADYTMALREDFLGWDSNESELFVSAELPGPEYVGPPWETTGRELVALGIGTVQAIGTIDLALKEVDWLGAFMVPDDGYFHARLPDGRYERGSETLLDSPAVVYFHGSRENPVRFLGRLVWSPDRTCYFYQTHRDGWFAKTWIEGYDVKTRERFTVRRLSFALYRK